jgi:chaperonin GroEL
VVPGGGVSLLSAARALDGLKLEPDQQVGVEIFKRALEEPTRQLANNAGLEGAVMVQHVERETSNIGLNALTGETEDLVKAGVIDPAKVTRSALQNAASVAALLLTTEALVADKPEKVDAAAAAAAAAGGMGGMGGMGMM